MKTKPKKKSVQDTEQQERKYFETHSISKFITDKDIDISLDDALKEDILTGKRKRKLKNFSMKIDPLYLSSVKKIATMKGIPYQTLVRQCITELVKKELKIA